MEEDEKLKKRKERFGILTSAAGAGDVEVTIFIYYIFLCRMQMNQILS